jgi:hypothetical protein
MGLLEIGLGLVTFGKALFGGGSKPKAQPVPQPQATFSPFIPFAIGGFFLILLVIILTRK